MVGLANDGGHQGGGEEEPENLQDRGRKGSDPPNKWGDINVGTPVVCGLSESKVECLDKIALQYTCKVIKINSLNDGDTINQHHCQVIIK